MNWTTAETKAVNALKEALEEAGFKDGRDDGVTSEDLLYFRDFIDDAALQVSATYFLFVVQPEYRSVAGDNAKVSYEVQLECYLATTLPPENNATITLRQKVEDEIAKAGFVIHFDRSSFDPELKLYLFQYRVSMEV